MLKNLVVFTGAMILAGSAAVLAEARPAADHTNGQIAVEKEAIELIEQLEEIGHDLRYHADRLASFPSPGSIESRWTHYHHLEEIKALVNDELRPALKRLTDIQAQLPEWKQESIDRMLISARELAADANSAFVTKAANANVPPAMNQEYKQLVTGMQAHAESLVTTSDAAHTYAAAHLRAMEAGLNVNK